MRGGSGAASSAVPVSARLKAQVAAGVERRSLFLQVKYSTEVGYVKLLLAQQHNIDSRKLKLFVQCEDGSQKLLIDPMSLCDYKEVKAPAATLIAQLDS